MFKFDIYRSVPHFILRDKNGYAVAKALAAGVQYMNDAISNGVGLISDYDTMPEWRLDELAWEYNVLYDYTADVETKRRWIKNAVQIYSIYGTTAIIKKYLQSAFFSAAVEEWWEYGGEPFHFRITITGEQNTENAEKTQKAVDTVKNVRSVLDNIIFSSTDSDSYIKAGTTISGIEVVTSSRTL